MPDKLALYQRAEKFLGNDTISALTDEVESRHVFDSFFDDVVETCFLEGDWNDFKSSVELVENTSQTPALGNDYVYDYPSDYFRTIAVSSYAGFDEPFYDFLDEGGFLSSNTSPLYIRYISNSMVDSVDSWRREFWTFVAVSLALASCEKLTGSESKEQRLEKKRKELLTKARSVDARNENNKTTPAGNWLRARRGAYPGRNGYNSHAGSGVDGEIVLGEGDV